MERLFYCTETGVNAMIAKIKSFLSAVAAGMISEHARQATGL